MMWRLKSLLAMPLLALSLAACQDDLPQVSEVRPVKAISIKSAEIRQIRVAIGDIQPRRESDLGFRVSGKLVSRNASVGAVVNAGDVVARVDDQDSRNRLKQALADVKAAEAVHQEAAANEARQRKLLAAGVTTKVNYDSAKKSLVSSEAALQSARVALKMAGDQIDYTELKADFDGVITATGAEAGQVVNAGQMIVRLAPAEERDAVFAIAESTIQEGGFHRGTRVNVSLLSEPGIETSGIVREVSPVADPATRTFEVKVAIDAPPSQLLFGVSVAGQVSTRSESGVALPPGAIFDEGGKPSVWLIQKDKRAVTLRPVTVARYEEDCVIVSGGLAQGDMVVTAGVNRLREGQVVKFSEEGSL